MKSFQFFFFVLQVYFLFYLFFYQFFILRSLALQSDEFSPRQVQRKKIWLPLQFNSIENLERINKLVWYNECKTKQFTALSVRLHSYSGVYNEIFKARDVLFAVTDKLLFLLISRRMWFDLTFRFIYRPKHNKFQTTQFLFGPVIFEFPRYVWRLWRR